MGNGAAAARRLGRAVEDRYTKPQGLYDLYNVDRRSLRRLIRSGKLAPCYPGDDQSDADRDLEECPICFQFYPSLNRSKCCKKGICTECYLQLTSTSITSVYCPFCKAPRYSVLYDGKKSKEEKAREQLEEQKVIEAQIRMQQQEHAVEAERFRRQLIVKRGQVSPSEVGPVIVRNPVVVQSTTRRNDSTSSRTSDSTSSENAFSRARPIEDVDFYEHLENEMLQEAIRISLLDLEDHSSGVTIGDAIPGASLVHNSHAGASSGIPTVDIFANQVVTPAEDQHRHIETSAIASSSNTHYDIAQMATFQPNEHGGDITNSHPEKGLYGSRNSVLREGESVSPDQMLEMLLDLEGRTDAGNA